MEGLLAPFCSKCKTPVSRLISQRRLALCIASDVSSCLCVRHVDHGQPILYQLRIQARLLLHNCDSPVPSSHVHSICVPAVPWRSSDRQFRVGHVDHQWPTFLWNVWGCGDVTACSSRGAMPATDASGQHLLHGWCLCRENKWRHGRHVWGNALEHSLRARRKHSIFCFFSKHGAVTYSHRSQSVNITVLWGSWT